jgi:tetratricopeptide (TPR) repeat protein/transcriptional regulator with XRE-family HTH domain
VAEQPAVTFAVLLRQLRSDAGLTQEELAASARMSVRTISDLERGVTPTARKKTAQLLADALHLTGLARTEFEAAARGRPVPGGAGAGEAAVAPRMLPRDIASFTGRQQELQELVDAAIGATESGGVVSIYAIGGMAGVGKTALAIRAAYQILPEFPDGQLFADLHGYTDGQTPALPGEILGMFLRRLGVDAADLPASVDERSGMLRDRLASKRVLMVLDNVATESQVRPLLPGGGASLVMITSRDSLAGLREVDQRIGLDVLPADQATVLLASLIGSERAAAEPGALRQVRDYCGRLPLALWIAGQNLAVRPSWTVAQFAKMLTDERDRLDTLEVGDRQVRSVFMVSYRQLPESAARMFRLLGLHPGPDFDVAAAASLAGIDAANAGRVVDRLTHAHLIVDNGSSRYGIHDLLRLCARQICRNEESQASTDAALTRLVGHFSKLAQSVDASLSSQQRPAAADIAIQAGTSPIPQGQALAIFETERLNLLAVLGLASGQGWHEQVRQLSASMANPLLLLRRLDDLLRVSEIALSDARKAGNTVAGTTALRWHGTAYAGLRRFDDAITCFQDALAICQKIGDRDGEGRMLNNLGSAYQEMRRFEDAIAWYEDALAICQETGDRLGQGRTLSNLGLAHSELRQFDQAIACHQQALTIRREAGDRLGEGRTLSNLGLAYSGQQLFEQAITCHQEALMIFREARDRYGEGHVLANLGLAHSESRQFEQAIADYQDALVHFREVGDLHEEGQVLSNLGTAHYELGQPDRAAAYWKDAAKAMNEAGEHQQAALLEQQAARTWPLPRGAATHGPHQ